MHNNKHKLRGLSQIRAIDWPFGFWHVGGMSTSYEAQLCDAGSPLDIAAEEHSSYVKKEMSENNPGYNFWICSRYRINTISGYVDPLQKTSATLLGDFSPSRPPMMPQSFVNLYDGELLFRAGILCYIIWKCFHLVNLIKLDVEIAIWPLLIPKTLQMAISTPGKSSTSRDKNSLSNSSQRHRNLSVQEYVILS